MAVGGGVDVYAGATTAKNRIAELRALAVNCML